MNMEMGMKAEVHVAGNVKEGPGHELFRAKDPFTLVIFGASGDLSRRKLIPALRTRWFDDSISNSRELSR